MSVSQALPVKPAGHRHDQDATSSTQEPWAHGKDAHSSISVSQSGPVKPAGQKHRYVQTHLFATVHSVIGWQVPVEHGEEAHGCQDTSGVVSGVLAGDRRGVAAGVITGLK